MITCASKKLLYETQLFSVEEFLAIFVFLFQGAHLVSSVYAGPIHITALQVFEFQPEKKF